MFDNNSYLSRFKKYMKSYFKGICLPVIVLTACLLVPQLIFAAPSPDYIDIDVPVDGGVSVLIAAGVAYGIKKIKDERKKKLDQIQ